MKQEHQTLLKKTYAMLVKAINPGKHFESDCASLLKSLGKKTYTELEITYNRQKAISKVTKKEAAKHCVFPASWK